MVSCEKGENVCANSAATAHEGLIMHWRLAIWLPLFLLSVPVAAEPVAIKTLLIVRAEGFFPPHEMLKNGQLTGVNIDLIEATAASMHINVVVETYPWVRAIEMLKKGQADAITFMSKTPEREGFAYFEEGNRLALVQNGFFTLKQTAPTILYSGDMRQLQPYTIGFIRGRRSFPDFDQATFLTKNESAKDEEQLLNMLMFKRFEVGMAPIARVKYIAMQKKIDEQLVYLQPLGPALPTYLAFAKAKGHGPLAKEFAHAMGVIKKSTQFQDILKKYGVKPGDY